MLYIPKIKEGSDQEISDLLEEGRLLAGKSVGVKTRAACLAGLTTEREKGS